MIAGAIKEVGIHLRNLLHTRRLKSVKLLIPAVLMGMAGGNASDGTNILSYWGRDPVHPLDITYANMAKKILEEVNDEAVVNARRPVSQQAVTARQGWASVLFKRTFRYLRSFTFFSKERSVLSVHLCSFQKNVPFFPFFSVLLKRTECSFLHSFPNLTNQTLT